MSIATKGHDLPDDLFRGRKPVTRETEGRFHDQGLRLAPLRWLGRTSWPQFEIAGVKERALFRFQKKLGRTKNVSGGNERDLKAADGLFLAEVQDVLVPFTRHPRLHEPRGALRDDDLVVRGDVIAVGMRHEGERLRIPRIEPDRFVRQINAAAVSNFNHAAKCSQLYRL